MVFQEESERVFLLKNNSSQNEADASKRLEILL